MIFVDFDPVKSYATCFELFATNMFCSSIINCPTFLARNLANLYVGACMLFTTGWIGFFFFISLH